MDYPDRGDGRKVHYGAGKQPIDTIKELGWYPEFCAGNVVKYLRRDKDLEHSEQSARVYFGWLKEAAMVNVNYQHALGIYAALLGELTTQELARLGYVGGQTNG